MPLLSWFSNRFTRQQKVLEFDNFNFKLAIIQQLMYDRKLLKPEYSYGETYHKRYKDFATVSDEVALARLQPYIEKGEHYFQNLKIPAKLAEKVEVLFCNVDVAVYFHINPQLDDYEEYFDDGRCYDVTAISEAEIRQFPNLTYIRFGSDIPGSLVQQLIDWGYEVGVD